MQTGSTMTRRALIPALLLFGCGEPGAGEPCNGARELCEKPLNEVAFAVTHNSFSTPDRFKPGFRNQSQHIDRQLEQGIRGLMLDTYWHDPPFSKPRAALCHRFCTVGGYTDLEPELADVAAFLAAHPREVVILLVEPHSLSPDRFEASMEKAGLLRFAFRDPVAGDQWPTLEELIEQDRRVVVFYENEQGKPDAAAPTFYRPLWESTWETPYSFDSVSRFSCDKNRGRAGAPFFLVNHFVSDPAGTVSGSREANTPQVLTARLAACGALQRPSLVAVDFFEQDGDPDDGVHSVVEAVRRLNADP
jgi:hypothetical protein